MARCKHVQLGHPCSKNISSSKLDTYSKRANVSHIPMVSWTLSTIALR